MIHIHARNKYQEVSSYYNDCAWVTPVYEKPDDNDMCSQLQGHCDHTKPICVQCITRSTLCVYQSFIHQYPEPYPPAANHW